MKIVKNQVFDKEREFYESDGLNLISCRFDGENDGESAMKESKNIIAKGCYFNLRYPFWHCNNVELINCELSPLCRAGLWYTENISARDSSLLGIKALRECKDATFTNCKIDSSEFGWLSSNISIIGCDISGEYFMLHAKSLSLSMVNFSGKYSFQYVENAKIDMCKLNTKDAFWHSKNVYVKNSVINGEYLGWYSENLTLENCIITGTQPLCYCKGLKLINCKMVDCDLSFERSYVEADLISDIESVKNPYDGYIKSPCVHNYIKDDEKYRCKVYSNGKLL
ncbi:MAG: DUF3737 family protein [Clostridia bacterium]|nr:DUF3737 family protein [Clostridia bacterium]